MLSISIFQSVLLSNLHTFLNYSFSRQPLFPNNHSVLIEIDSVFYKGCLSFFCQHSYRLDQIPVSKAIAAEL